MLFVCLYVKQDQWIFGPIYSIPWQSGGSKFWLQPLMQVPSCFSHISLLIQWPHLAEQVALYNPSLHTEICNVSLLQFRRNIDYKDLKNGEVEFVSFTFTLADGLEHNHDNISLCIYHSSLNLHSVCNWRHIYPRNTTHNTL